MVFGVRVIHSGSSAYRIDGGVDVLFGGTGVFQDFAGGIVLLNQRQRKQFAGDIGVTAFNGGFVHQVENGLQFAAGQDFAARAGYAGQAA